MVARFYQVAADPAQTIYKLAIRHKPSLPTLVEGKNGTSIQSSLSKKPEMLTEDQFFLRWSRCLLMDDIRSVVTRISGKFNVNMNGLLHNAKVT
jgi:hypothetical protein